MAVYILMSINWGRSESQILRRSERRERTRKDHAEMDKASWDCGGN